MPPYSAGVDNGFERVCAPFPPRESALLPSPDLCFRGRPRSGEGDMMLYRIEFRIFAPGFNYLWLLNGRD